MKGSPADTQPVPIVTCAGAALGNPDRVVQSEYGRAVAQLNILNDRAINLVLFPRRGTMIQRGCKTRRKCVKPAK